MIATLYLFGREVFSVSLSRPATPPEPDAPEPTVKPDAGPFGFGGGSFGTQERSSAPEPDRPIDSE